MASILLGLLFINFSIVAQEVVLKNPSLEELIPGGEHFIFTQNKYNLSWWGDQCIEPSYSELYAINPKNGDKKLITTSEEVNKILNNHNLPNVRNLYQVQMPWPKEKALIFYHEGSYIKIDLEAKTASYLIQLNKKAKNVDFSPIKNNVAYTINNNLYVNRKQVTDNPKGVVAGQTVHRSEFGIRKGIFWSPKGDLVAFYNMDERMVTEYPLVDITTRIATLDPIRYPMAGMKSHKVKVGIYSSLTGEAIYLNTGDPTDRYFTNIQWSPDQRTLYLIELNREQNHSKLCAYSAISGELERVLYEEKHDKYVEPQNPIEFIPWDDNLFIYQSQKSGYNHLYLFDKSGKQISQLTSGEWLIKSILGFNTKKREVITTSTYYSPLKENILAIAIKNGKIRSLDNQEGVHRPILSSSGNYIIDRLSSPNTPNTINLVNCKTGEKTTLLTAPDPFAGYTIPKISIGTIKASDGKTDLYYRLVEPKNLDKSKKYPAIIYVYGGPHAQMITDSWNYGVRGWDIYMANKGYVVLTVDNRGSDNRGLEFENATFRNLGIIEGEDQVEGTKLLKQLNYVDMDRIGVHGWSFGGHMTTALLLRYPNIFKVGVAGGPVIDWSLYEIMYGERYMDTPETNKGGYAKTNLCHLAGELKGKLLLIHDGHDSTCVPQHTLSFIKACIEARTYPDLFIYPGHAHNVRGRDRVHLYEKVTQYFDSNL